MGGETAAPPSAAARHAQRRAGAATQPATPGTAGGETLTASLRDLGSSPLTSQL